MSGVLPSGEEYLKWILRVEQMNGNVRSIDLAQSMNYSKASVSVAIKKLVDKKFVVKDDKGYLHLTNAGLEIATNLNERHLFLTNYLINIGVSPNVALADACKLEHVLSEESYMKLKESAESKE